MSASFAYYRLVSPVLMGPFAADVRLFAGFIPADGFAPGLFTFPVAAIPPVVAVMPVIVVIIAVTPHAPQHSEQQRGAEQKEYGALHTWSPFSNIGPQNNGIPERQHTTAAIAREISRCSWEFARKARGGVMPGCSRMACMDRRGKIRSYACPQLNELRPVINPTAEGGRDISV